MTQATATQIAKNLKEAGLSLADIKRELFNTKGMKVAQILKAMKAL